MDAFSSCRMACEELFDVANLAADYPERVQRLQILLDTEKAKDNDALPAPIRTGAIESDYGTSSRIR
jgi:hypothetical protein